MAITYISGEAVASSATAGSTTITVPADCTGIIVTWGAYYTGTISISTMTIDGSGLTIDNQSSVTSSAYETGAASIVDPSTGSVTFAWAWTGATHPLDEGAVYNIHYLKGIDTADFVQDIDETGGGTAGPVSVGVTLTTTATDMIVGHVKSYISNPVGALNGQTVSIDNTSSNQDVVDAMYQASPGEGSTEFIGYGEYPRIIGVVVKAGAVASPKFLTLLGVG